MKKETINETNIESKNRQGIQDAWAVPGLQPMSTKEDISAKTDEFNIFLNQNIGKGSSGNSRSPDMSNELKTNTRLNFNSLKKNYYDLNFTIMKKQILFLVFFILAAFANVNKTYGQCTPDPLHPAAGVAYDYEITILNGTGTTPVFNWYVTKDVNILLPGVTIIAPGVDFLVNAGVGLSTYNSATSTTNKINMTWTSASVASATPYYLVVKYSETGTAGCTVENMRVWMVDPVNTFLLAVAGSDLAGVVTNNSTCAANIDGALITAGASPTVAYTYGQNTLYYKITASGSTGTWTPSISLPALAGLGQNYNAADWSDDAGATWNTFNLTDGDLDGGTFTSTATDAPVSAAGSDIIVRIVVDNVNYETLLDQAIILGVDGELPGGVKDIVSVADCTDEADFGKTGTFTINRRPTITDATTNTPNVTDFITKNP